MTTTQPHIDADYCTAVATDIVRIDALIADLQEQRAAHQAIIDQAVADGVVTHGQQLGDATISVRRGAKRLDAKKLEETYPAAQWPSLYSLKIDTKLVRGALAPNALAPFETVGADSVTVKAAA